MGLDGELLFFRVGHDEDSSTWGWGVKRGTWVSEETLYMFDRGETAGPQAPAAKSMTSHFLSSLVMVYIHLIFDNKQRVATFQEYTRYDMDMQATQYEGSG